MQEKRIKGFPDYTVCSNGQIFSYKKAKRALRGTISRGGYHYVDLCQGDGVKHRFAVHRLVGEYFCEGYFEGAVINHIDGNKLNNSKENLEWVTQTENIHKSYITSGIGAMRNYFRYQLVVDGAILPKVCNGFRELQQYYQYIYPDIPFKQLEKWGKAHEYTTLKFPKS